jgi:hypothetical protein
MATIKEKMQKVAAAAHVVALKIERNEIEPGEGTCFKDSAPVCSFGHVLKEAGYSTSYAFLNPSTLHRFLANASDFNVGISPDLYNPQSATGRALMLLTHVNDKNSKDMVPVALRNFAHVVEREFA